MFLATRVRKDSVFKAYFSWKKQEIWAKAHETRENL